MQIAIAEAKGQFADLIRRAEAGQEIEPTRSKADRLGRA